MFPALKNKKRIYINAKGKILLETDFVGFSEFKDERSPVFINGKIGFIDTNGNILIRPKFEEVREFQESKCAVKINGKWGFVDENGVCIIKHKYYKTGNFSNGLVGVQDESLEKTAYINESEQIIIDDNGLPNIYDFSEGLLACRENKSGLWGFRNTSGNWEIKPQYGNAGNFSENFAGVEKNKKSDSKTSFIDKYNNEILPALYETVSPCFKDGLAVVTKKVKGDYKRGAIDKTGEVVIPFEYQILGNFSDGMASCVLKKNGKYGFVGKDGKFVEPQYDRIFYEFKDGIALVERNEKLFYIDKNGKTVFEFS